MNIHEVININVMDDVPMTMLSSETWRQTINA